MGGTLASIRGKKPHHIKGCALCLSSSPSPDTRPAHPRTQKGTPLSQAYHAYSALGGPETWWPSRVPRYLGEPLPSPVLGEPWHLHSSQIQSFSGKNLQSELLVWKESGLSLGPVVNSSSVVQFWSKGAKIPHALQNTGA